MSDILLKKQSKTYKEIKQKEENESLGYFGLDWFCNFFHIFNSKSSWSSINNVRYSYIKYSYFLFITRLRKTPVEVIMADYSTIKKDVLEYTRNLFRNDATLCVTILGLSGTTDAINNIFVKRLVEEKLNPDDEPNFPLPRIVVDLIGADRGKMGDNLDGQNESEVDFQVSFWVNENPWDLSLKASDRMESLLENDNMPVTNGWAKFKIISSDDIKDPDRRQTRMGTIRVKTTILGGG